MSEKQRLLSDRRDDIAEERESNGSDSPTETTSISAKIRHRRQSPPNNHDLNSNSYGTISDIKYQPMSGSSTSRTHFTKKQTIIALIAFLLFAAGVAVTLILGLPRLEAKRREYFEARFFESPLQPVNYGSKAVLLNSAPECSRLAREQGSVIDATVIATLCSLVSSPHLIRPDSRLTAIYFHNGTAHEISTSFDTLQLNHKNGVAIGKPILFETLERIHRQFNTQSNMNFSDILSIASKLAENGVALTSSLSKTINKNLEEQSKWKSDFLRVTTSTDGTVRPGQIVKNPALSQFFRDWNATNLHQLLNKDFVANFQTSPMNITDTQVLFKVPLKTDFFSRTVFAPNSPAGVSLNRFLRIQSLLNEKFDQCNDEARTLRDGTLEFHYLIESLKHASEALARSVIKLDTDQEILERSKKILAIKENNEIQLDASEYGFDANSSALVDAIQKKSSRRSLQILIEDTESGDSMILVAQNRRDLFDGEKYASKSLGFVLDLFEDNANAESVEPEVVPMLVLSARTNTPRFLLTSEYDSSAAVAQVFSKLILGCQTLKRALDESRIFYSPHNNHILIEDKFPRAYIDLLMRLYGHHNLETFTDVEQRSSVFAIQVRDTPSTVSTLDMVLKKIAVFFDWRSHGEGYLNGN